MADPKKTTLYETHTKLNAKMVPFAGYYMPIQYSGIVEEHLKVRESVGIFDVSHMGEFRVRGADAEKFLNNLTVNDVSQLVPGKAHYSMMLYPEGGIVDDLIIYKFADDDFMMVVNAANLEKDFNWAEDHLPEGVDLTNQSDDIGLLAVQGPNSVTTLQKLTGVNLGAMSMFTFVEDELAGRKMIISATGYTGERGFELYLKAEDAPFVWDAVMKSGEEFGILPIGLGARDTLRMEKKMALYGNDIDQDTNPLEAGLGWVVKLDKENFIGKEALVRINEAGLKRRHIAFKMLDKGIPRHYYKILSEEGKEIGIVTSGTHSPSLGQGIGLGYVDFAFRKPGTKILIENRNKNLLAQIVKPPLV
ncbi:MAG: glycine cleavage system aminomethyltransferase GcvT [Candidatus Marinimicrobia bacterium]|nr:glycine cleavage system aminomethyltransferase GcvT [Candidatus Neomarinimicrobiota bacterium]